MATPARTLPFTKMHGIGNDYVYVDGFDPAVADVLRVGELPELARRLADRHFGVGGDGMILLLPPVAGPHHESHDGRMRVFNADGSEAQMCGNGVRCVAKLAYDRRRTRANPMRVLTGNGVLSLALEVDSQDDVVRSVTVDMGRPRLSLSEIPVRQAAVVRTAAIRKRDEYVYELAFKVHKKPVRATFVNVGNPHAVIFLDAAGDLEGVDLHDVGPKLERYVAFPERMNVHFARADAADRLTMRTWERGSGVTLACGTGACATLVAAHLTGRAARQASLTLPGGELLVRWDAPSDHLFLTGPAAEAFRGEWPLESPGRS